jgi:hypothetical protein
MTSESAPTPSRRRISLKGAIPVLLAAAITAVGVSYLVRAARKSALRMSEGNTMKQIALALHNFHGTHKRFPAAMYSDKQGRPLSSWRFQIVPYLESIMLDIPYDLRWDDPANGLMSSWAYPPYCWSSETPHTRIVAVTGPGTAFDETKVATLADIDPDTILVVEIAESQIHWMEPRDLPWEAITEATLRGEDGDGFWVVFADGATMFLRADVPLENVRKFLTVDSAKRYDRDQLLTPYAANVR